MQNITDSECPSFLVLSVFLWVIARKKARTFRVQEMHVVASPLLRTGALVPARKAYNLGDQIFRAQACEIWGLVPDLFADPEVRVKNSCSFLCSCAG